MLGGAITEDDMDPNATLKAIDEFLAAHRTGEYVDELCEALYDWLAAGGFQPDWSKHSLGTSYYECRKVAIQRGKRLA